MGDIHDESDVIIHEIEVVKEDEYIVLGIAKIDLVNDLIGVNINSEDYDSIGGFVLGLFGRLPETGQLIEHDSIKFVVEKMHRNRIEKLRILT
ncbi:MAG: transporter associated domain-containing protein [Dethiobacteria bacterium]|nr:transporter associated domain-containing protein [Dethiobacteria bacterium]